MGFSSRVLEEDGPQKQKVTKFRFRLRLGSNSWGLLSGLLWRMKARRACFEGTPSMCHVWLPTRLSNEGIRDLHGEGMPSYNDASVADGQGICWSFVHISDVPDHTDIVAHPDEYRGILDLHILE